MITLNSPRKSSSVLSSKRKNLISNKHKSCVVYTFECCCSNSYISRTSRHLENKIKEHISKYVSDHINNLRKTFSIATSNAMNRSSLPETLIKIPYSWKLYNGIKFRTFRSCNNNYDLIKTVAIYIHLNKQKLCKQREFDYSISLFS